MRLINTETGEFENFVDLENTPPYAILSHTWDKDGEQTYQEVVEIQKEYKHSSPPEEEAPSRSDSDEAGSVPEVLTPSEIDTSSHTTSPPSPASPRAFFISLGILRILLPLQWALIFSIVYTWPSRTPGPGTPLQPVSSPADIQTPTAAPPAFRPSIWDPDSGLSEKVRRACEIARGDGYLYIWVDSSCIDKSSSSELSEAINSMYNWYRNAQVCYAFLVDVPSDEDVREKRSKFRESRWFKRCWTLQELIAPLMVVFLSKTWEDIGTKDSLANVIYDITSINRGILMHERALSDESVADRMRWAANREATRVEDEAYSLLGIFGITMPTLYGEGQHAFRRLQEEILQRIPDQSIFAWGDSCVPFPLEPCKIYLRMTDSSSETLLALSPHSFKVSRNSHRSQTIRATGDPIESLALPVQEYIHNPYGIRTRLCLLPLQALNPHLNFNFLQDKSDPTTWYLALLGCQQAGDPKRLLSRRCCLRNDSPNVEFLFVPDHITMYKGFLKTVDFGVSLFTISLDDLVRNRNQLQTKTVYLPHPRPSVNERRLKGQHNTLNLTLPVWVQAALRMHGYTISNVQSPTEDDPNSFSFSLVHASFNIHIHYRHMTRSSAIIIQARVWILSSDKEALRTDAAILSSPPYISTTWDDRAPWDMTPQRRRLDLIAESGEQVTLQLGLHLTALSRYNVHVDVVQTGTGPADGGAASLRADSRRQSIDRRLHPYHDGTFNLILTGSVRRALEKKGYSPRLALDPCLGGFQTHSLTLSRDTESFAVVIKLFCTVIKFSRSPEVAVVARITLESSILDNEVVQDGPHVVTWRDSAGSYSNSLQERSMEDNHIVLTTPTEQSLTLHLGFNRVWISEYHLHVDIKSITSQSQSPQLPCPPARDRQRHDDNSYTLALAHGRIDLTLPGHVRRALQDQGYQLQGLDRGGESDDPVRHLLTLCHITAGITIAIEYSHHLPVTTNSRELEVRGPSRWPDKNYPFLLADPHPDSSISPSIHEVQWRGCQQELVFKASARVLPFGSDIESRAGVQNDLTTATVDWNAKYEYRRGPHFDTIYGWRRHLPNKDITLTLPTGHQLVLRIGFYYVCDGEYCLIVQINPREPLSPTPSRDEGPSMPDYELDEAGMEYIQQSLAGRTEPEQSEETHDEPLPTDLDVAVVAFEALPFCGEDGDSDGGASGGGSDLGVDDEEPAPVRRE